MSDLKLIKKKLLDERRVEDVLRAIDCEYLNYSGGRLEAQLPYDKFQSNNKRAVQIKMNENLSSSIRNRPDFKRDNGTDIYHLVSYIHHDKRGSEIDKDLHNAKRFICETLGWTEFLKGGAFLTKKDYVAPLKAFLRDSPKRREVIPNAVLPEETLNTYYYQGNPITYEKWAEEGIPHSVQKLYGVGFDLESKRVVLPLRNRFGQLVGVKGRIMKDEDDPEKKYLYIHPCQNRLEWFNFHYAHPYILEYKKVYIFESEKSCMKANGYGIFNTLAIGASDVSIEQASTIKQLGLDIEIILCYDKGISIDAIKKQAEHFKGRKVYGMFDTDNILNGKDSPVDEGLEKWEYLVKNNIYEIN